MRAAAANDIEGKYMPDDEAVTADANKRHVELDSKTEDA